MYTYEDLSLELNAETKDEKKGQKDAIKALKKADELTPILINTLMDGVYKRTSNTEYISAYVDVLRQALAAVQACA